VLKEILINNKKIKLDVLIETENLNNQVKNHIEKLKEEIDDTLFENEEIFLIY
jgi:hypothetical protein